MKAISIDDHVLSIVCSVFDAYSAVLFLPDEGGERHYLAASFSLGDHIPEEMDIIPGKGLVGWILLNRKELMVNDFDRHKNSLGYYGPETEADIKAFMGFPVPTGGAICVDSTRKYSFTDKDSKLLQLFAELIARQQSLDNGDMIGKIPRYFAELGVIQDLRFRYKRWPAFLKNFLRTIKEATEFDYCAFATLQEAGDFYCLECESDPLLLATGQMLRFSLGSGLTGWVFLNEQPIYAENGGLSGSSALFGKIRDMPDFPAAICLPVMVNKSCRGVLCMANSQTRKTDESMHAFLRQAVDHLSLFLENLYLKSRLRDLMPKTAVEREGSRVYNPDTAPMPRINDDD